MNRIDIDSPIRIDRVSLRGPGVLILTGPSSCGKGEVANALSKVLSIPTTSHLSMGDILRTTFQKAKHDVSYARLLEENYHISKNANIFDCVDTTEELTRKVNNHLPDMENYFKRHDMVHFTSQLEWLEFCTMNGLLVPNRWTQSFIAAHIEHTLDFRSNPFILDGYPRTVDAARHLLGLLKVLEIPVIKVLHMSISKQEMLSRAVKRGRADDDEQSLLSRYQFYIESVQPSVDYMKMELGADVIALIDAHQPVFDPPELGGHFNLKKSINKVVSSSLRSLGVPRIVVRDLMTKLEA